MHSKYKKALWWLGSAFNLVMLGIGPEAAQAWFAIGAFGCAGSACIVRDDDESKRIG